MTGLLISLGLVTRILGSDISSFLVNYCTDSQQNDIQQSIISLQDGYNDINNYLMCTDACDCVTVVNSQWSAMGYDISMNNFTGSN